MTTKLIVLTLNTGEFIPVVDQVDKENDSVAAVVDLKTFGRWQRVADFDIWRLEDSFRVPSWWPDPDTL